MNKKFSSRGIARLTIYHRILNRLKKENKAVISSKALGQLCGFSDAQVRKDLTFFGSFGRPGKGYNVNTLNLEITKILGKERRKDVILIGAGNLGAALLSYNAFRSQGYNIVHIFDNDRKKIGKSLKGLIIEDIKNLAKIIKNSNIDIAIVTVPADTAQEVIDELVCSGVKAILNFAPTKIMVGHSVRLHNVDLSLELDHLSYLLADK